MIPSWLARRLICTVRMTASEWVIIGFIRRRIQVMIAIEEKAERKQQRQQLVAALSPSGSTLALYLMVSAFIGFFVIRVLTTQEIIVALGTIVLAVVGMWLIAFLSKLRLIVRSFRYHQVNGKEKPAHKIHGGIANARYR